MDETRMRLTDAQRQERMLQLQRTMQLLVHASSCTGRCPSSNCNRVKALFAHAMTCDKAQTGVCNHCRCSPACCLDPCFLRLLNKLG